jgi:hypothetical protein
MDEARVMRIATLEEQSRSRGDVLTKRKEQARLITEELASGTTAAELAEVLGADQQHVVTLMRAHIYLWGPGGG